MDELRPGLWTWTARHPAWQRPEDGWSADVRSYAIETDGTLVLVDPLAPPRPLDGLAAGRTVVVVLTVFDHERSTAECAERLGARVFAPRASVDVIATPATGYADGDALPGGVQACTGFWPHEATLWLPAYRALVTGDVLICEPRLSILPDDWLEDTTTPEQVKAGLQPLLELPVELVLPTHGDPVLADARAQLAAALS